MFGWALAYLTTPLEHVRHRQVGNHDVGAVGGVGAQLVEAGAAAGDDVLVGKHDALWIA